MTSVQLRDVRFAFVVSTAGSVMNQVLSSVPLRKRVAVAIMDRDCPAIGKAQAHGLPVERCVEPSVDAFCEKLDRILRRHRVDYVLSYYTSFYSDSFRGAWRDRLVNFHPSLLPAFKGMDGFGDAVAYQARYLGNTVEFIDEVIDEGKIIMQTAFAHDPAEPIASSRHRLFVQQCQALLQTASWLADGRIVTNGRRVDIRGARFDSQCFSPALESEEAISLGRHLSTSDSRRLI